MSLKVRKNFIKIIYTVLSRVLSSRAELYSSWDAYDPMLGVQFVNFPFLSNVQLPWQCWSLEVREF